MIGRPEDELEAVKAMLRAALNDADLGDKTVCPLVEYDIDQDEGEAWFVRGDLDADKLAATVLADLRRLYQAAEAADRGEGETIPRGLSREQLIARLRQKITANPPATACGCCGVKLDQPGLQHTRNVGGDCLACMDDPHTALRLISGPQALGVAFILDQSKVHRLQPGESFADAFTRLVDERAAKPANPPADGDQP